MLHVNLVENPLKGKAGTYMAQPAGVRSYSENEIIEEILRRGSTVTKADILSVVEMYKEVVLGLVSDGNAVTTPLFNAFPSVAGVFTGANDLFDPDRHRVKINLLTGKELREAIRGIKVTKVSANPPVPRITEVKDIVSNTVNKKLTPGGVLQIRGNQLKILESKPGNGVFFIDPDGNAIPSPLLIENNPSKLLLQIPSGLAPGKYFLEIRTNFSNTASKESKQTKEGRFRKRLEA